MDTITPNNVLNQFDAQTDDTLRTLIDRARTILGTRDQKRKNDALAEIRRIAKAHGLDVNVRKPALKRGRPPKAGATG